MGFTSIFQKGLIGPGLIVLILGSLVTWAFSTKYIAQIYAGASIFIIAVFIPLIHFEIISYDSNGILQDPNLLTNWIIKFMVFSLCIVATSIIVNTIKKTICFFNL